MIQIIKINFALVLCMLSLSGCANLYNSLFLKNDQSPERSMTEADSIEESGIRQLEGDTNLPRSKQGLQDACYDGWSSGTYEVTSSGKEIVALQEVRDCEGRFYALSLDNEGEVAVWDLERGLRRKMFELPQKVDTAVFSDSGRYIASAKGHRLIIFPLWAGLGEPLEFKRITSNIVSLAFDAEEHAILAGAADSNIYRWVFDAKNFANKARKDASGLDRYSGHATVVSAIAAHPYGRVFISADWNGVVKAWLTYDSDPYGGKYDKNLFGRRFFADVPVNKPLQRSDGERVDQLRVSENGKYFIVTTQDGMLELWQVRGLSKIAETKAHNGLIYGAAINKAGDEVATIARDGVLKFWHKERKQERLKNYELKLNSEQKLPGVRELMYLSDGRLVSGSLDGKVEVVTISPESLIVDRDDFIVEVLGDSDDE